MNAIIDLSGLRFGRLIVVRREPRPGKPPCWICRCDCGTETIVFGGNLARGNTTSCGCAHADIMRSRITHGQTSGGEISPENKAWQGMRARCENPNITHYADYGGRGITVCERWQKFENFFADMGLRPSPKHTLDRYPNNNGNYEPGNCRWATMLEQQRNRRSNRIVKFRNDEMCLSAAVALTGLKYDTVWARLKRGWSEDRALGVGE